MYGTHKKEQATADIFSLEPNLMTYSSEYGTPLVYSLRGQWRGGGGGLGISVNEQANLKGQIP